MSKKTENHTKMPEEPNQAEQPTNPKSTESTLLNDLQRTRADFENYRKNVEKDKENLKKYAEFNTNGKILPLLDDLDRAFLTYSKELSPLAKNLDKTLKSLNLEKIETTPGVEFNPDFHEAVMFEESDGEKEVISETLRPGYKYNGEILRPAMVKVKRI